MVEHNPENYTMVLYVYEEPKLEGNVWKVRCRSKDLMLRWYTQEIGSIKHFSEIYEVDLVFRRSANN